MEDKLKDIQKANDLSDIVLEKEDSSADKTKKLLLFAASLILLFLIALVVMKMFSGAEKPTNAIAEVAQEMEQKVDNSIDQISKKVDDTNSLFTQEPIIDENSETDIKFEEMVRKLKAQTTDDAIQAVTKVTETTTTTVKEVAPKISIQEVKEPAKPISEAKSKIRKEVIVSAPRPTRITETKLTSLSGYFVQVGATANSFPDKVFLRKIKNAGFDYIVHTMTVKGRKIKKVLVGPYTSRNQAKSKLPTIQSRINPDAYIFRIK